MVEEKDLERKFDSNNVCGITNDQMISMEQLKLGNKRVETEEKGIIHYISGYQNSQPGKAN